MELNNVPTHQVDFQDHTAHTLDGQYKYHHPPTSKDWEHIRPLLTRLYQDEKQTLAAVISHVKTQYDFRASSRLFKRRFAEWCIERKFKSREVRYMLVLEHLHRSSGKGTKFLLHGRQVNSEDLRRYVRRKQLKVSQVLEDYSEGKVQSCEWVQCQTPRSASPCLFSTRQQQTIDSLFCAWKKLIRGSLDLGLAYPGDMGLVWIYHDGHTKPDIFRAFDVFQDFIHYSRASLGYREMLLLRRGCLLMESAITCSSFLWWIGIVGVIAVLVHAGKIALAKILLTHVDGMASAKLHPSAPHKLFLRQLADIPLESFVPLTTELFRILIDIESSIRSDDPGFTWHSRVDLWAFVSRHSDRGLDASAFDLLQEGTATYGPGPENKMREALIDHAFWAGLDLKSWYSTECQNRELPLLGWDHPFDEFNGIEDDTELGPFALSSLGCRCFNEGDLIGARSCWTRAVTSPFLAEDGIFLDDSSIHYVLEYLDFLSTESKIADGNLKWRKWKAKIEARWQSELNLACGEMTIRTGSDHFECLYEAHSSLC